MEGGVEGAGSGGKKEWRQVEEGEEEKELAGGLVPGAGLHAPLLSNR